MPKSQAERLREYRQRVKNDPMKYQEYFKKEREGNKTWKEEGKLKSVNDLSIREQIQVRRAWTARPQDVPEKTQRDKMDNKGSISFQRVRRLSPVDDFTEDLVGKWCIVTYDNEPYPGIIEDAEEGMFPPYKYLVNLHV